MAGNHFCRDVENFPLKKFFQTGAGIGEKIIIVGDSLGKDDLKKNVKVFSTSRGVLNPSGRELNTLLSPFNVNLEMCAYTDIIKCYLTQKEDFMEHSRIWWPIFKKQLEISDFKLIITLGVTTLEILNENLKINLKMGTIQQVEINNKTYNVLSIYHPSPINPKNKENNQYILNKVGFDFQRIINSF